MVLNICLNGHKGPQNQLSHIIYVLYFPLWSFTAVNIGKLLNYIKAHVTKMFSLFVVHLCIQTLAASLYLLLAGVIVVQFSPMLVVFPVQNFQPGLIFASKARMFRVETEKLLHQGRLQPTCKYYIPLKIFASLKQSSLFFSYI